MPSISPTVATDALSVPTRNTGNSPWIISDDMSMNSDTSPSATTVRGSAFATADGGAETGLQQISKLIHQPSKNYLAMLADLQKIAVFAADIHSGAVSRKQQKPYATVGDDDRHRGMEQHRAVQRSRVEACKLNTTERPFPTAGAIEPKPLMPSVW